MKEKFLQIKTKILNFLKIKSKNIEVEEAKPHYVLEIQDIYQKSSQKFTE
jgi:hypothetical protein